MCIRDMYRKCMSVLIALLMVSGAVSFPSLNIVLEAYASDLIIVTFNAGGGTISRSGQSYSEWFEEANINSLLDPPTGVSYGTRRLEGWFRDNGAQWNFQTDTAQESMTLTARWDPPPTPTPTQTITFRLFTYPVGADPYTTVTATVTQGLITRIWPQSRVGYNLPVYAGAGSVMAFNNTTNAATTGWYTDRNFTSQFAGALYDSSFTAGSNRTIDLFARFQRTVRYSAAGSGSFASPTHSIADRVFFVDASAPLTNPPAIASPIFLTTTALSGAVNGGMDFLAHYNILGWYRNTASTGTDTVSTERAAAVGIAGLLAADFANGTATVYANPKLVSDSRVRVTLNYNNDVDFSRSFDVYSGSRLLGLPTLPTRFDGASFIGWFDEAGTQWVGPNPTNTVTGPTILNARYQYTVNFDLRGGTMGVGGPSTYGPVYVTVGQLLPEPSPRPVRPGYVFVGWYSTATDAYVFFAPGGATIYGSTTLIAYWAVEGAFSPGDPLPILDMVTVTYDAAGGTPTDTTQTVQKGIPFPNAATTPTLTNHVFVGWFLGSESEPWNFNTRAANDHMTLTARWLKRYTVEYWSEHQATRLRSEPIIENGNIPFFTPVRPGFVFLGWEYAQGGGTQLWNGISPSTLQLTRALGGDGTVFRLDAKWRELPKVTLVYNDGIHADATHYITGAHPTALGAYFYNFTTPSSLGYEFLGWYDAGNVIHNKNTAIYGDITVTARWLKGDIEITFDPLRIGAEYPIITFYEIKGRSIVTRVPSYPEIGTGERIVSWHLDPGCLDDPVNFNTFTAEDDIIFYAKWGPPLFITITFKDPYGNVITGVNETGIRQVSYGSTLNEMANPPTPVDSRYMFMNRQWLDEDGELWDSEAAFTSNMTLTARVRHRMTFDSNGGAAIGSPIQWVIRGELAEPPDETPVRPGHNFLGWYIDKNFTQEWSFSVDTVMAHTTLYARWELFPDQPPTITSVTGEYTLAVVVGNTGELVFDAWGDARPQGKLDFMLEMIDGSTLPDSVVAEWVSAPVIDWDIITGQIVLKFSPDLTEIGNIYRLNVIVSDGALSDSVVVTLIALDPRSGQYLWWEIILQDGTGTSARENYLMSQRGGAWPNLSGTDTSNPNIAQQTQPPSSDTGSGGFELIPSTNAGASGTSSAQQNQTNNSGSSSVQQNQTNNSGSNSAQQNQTNNSGSNGAQNNQPNNSGSGGIQQTQPDNSGQGGTQQTQPDNSGQGGTQQTQPDNPGQGGAQQTQPDNSDQGGTQQTQPDNSGQGGSGGWTTIP